MLECGRDPPLTEQHSNQRVRRFFQFDNDTQKWGVYELISPEFKDVEGCVRWSGKNRCLTKRRNRNAE